MWGKVDALGQDLVYCASTYAKVIISELGLPLVRRCIRRRRRRRRMSKTFLSKLGTEGTKRCKMS